MVFRVDLVQSLITSQYTVLVCSYHMSHTLIANCESGEDYYCMYYDAIPTVVDIIAPLAPESLKSCTVKNPKIKDIKYEVDNAEDVEDEFDFRILVEIGATRERQTEYFIYDTLSIVGTVGGTLGLFVGFSFYDFISMLIDMFFDKLKID